MQRRDFITKAAITALSVKTLVLSSTQAAALGIHSKYPLEIPKIYDLNPKLSDQFMALIEWMTTNGWADLVTRVSGLSLNMSGINDPNLVKVFQPKLNTVIGCDDFIGDQLLNPGKPQESLLYHLLASPRVRLDNSTSGNQYPSLVQLDLLENVIYGMVPLTTADLTADGTVLAVFAYEYRPSSKTPHGWHADLVFSRSGFSRVGSKPVSYYDAVNRCFTNKPQDTLAEKEIAVAPARYALFLATLVSSANVENNDPQKGNEFTHYLLPKRKIFTEDPAIAGYDLFFEESHVSERLRKLCQKTDMISMPQGIAFDLDKSPFIRRSSSSTNSNAVFAADYDKQMVDLTPVGSSVLLSSHPMPLVSTAEQIVAGKSQRIRVKIPPLQHDAVSLFYTNRRYTSLKVLDKDAQHGDAIDVLKDAVLNHNGPPITHYEGPRNAPMFINIREEVDEATGKTITQMNSDYPNLLQKINSSYWVGLFQDNICDGCVTASFSGNQPTALINKLLNLTLLPAFSIVTAPDFFPMVESYDMVPFQKLFLSGGTQDTSGARLKANPNIDIPGTQISAFPNNSDKAVETSVEGTILAIITGKPNPKGKFLGYPHDIEQSRTQTRANYLPDSATLIFFPGWDMTYSNDMDNVGLLDKSSYSTMGLGLPFMEDSKLCAAANGMWAAASPDSSRTFRGTLSPIPTQGLAPTAVPLLDTELGIHPQSPAVKDFGLMSTTGWDGEQGPFLAQSGNGFLINFTDINRSDYVQNALHGQFDMSLMRKITVADVTDRMDALQRCYKIFDRKKIWLVGVERIDNWNTGTKGYCVPRNLLSNARPFTLPGQGSGYLYLFAETDGDVSKTGTKRVTQDCKTIHICLISKKHIKICTMKYFYRWNPSWTSYS